MAHSTDPLIDHHDALEQMLDELEQELELEARMHSLDPERDLAWGETAEEWDDE